MREMKDSGVAWIGEIPTSWDTKAIRNLLIERNEKNRELSVKTILSLSAKSGVTLYSSENHSGNKPREDLSDYKIVRENDIVVNSMNILSGSVGLSKYTGVVSPVYYIYYPREKNNVQYLYFIFQCFEFQRSLRGLGNGILIKETESGSLNTIRMRIPSKKLSLQELPSPPIDEQEKIAAHLDRKCTQIDALISNAQQQIEKLKAYKQSVITETVTKGLDPDVEMKDSGNIFIGKIPEHWESMKLKYLCNMQAGKNLVSEQIAPTGEYKVYGGNGVRGFFNDFNCNGEYLLVGRQGALCGNVHYVNGKFWATEHAVITTSKTNNELKFLFYLLTGMNLNQYVSPTAAQPGLAVGSIQAIISCLPPLAEQRTIVTYLDRKCTQIDKLIALKQQKIEKLQQYKKSLIYEYVTGKKEV